MYEITDIDCWAWNAMFRIDNKAFWFAFNGSPDTDSSISGHTPTLYDAIAFFENDDVYESKEALSILERAGLYVRP